MTAMSEGLCSWDVRRADGRAGSGGISTDRERAMEALVEAVMGEEPGGWGTVWAVRLKAGGRSEYSYEALVAKVLHDPRSGAVTVEEVPDDPD
jgi:hypothetical protein